MKFRPQVKERYQETQLDKYNLSQFPVTDPEEIPRDFLIRYNNQEEFAHKEGEKLLKVALVGPSNSGKSSLLNLLIGKHISAVSNKQFTTTDEIIGVMTS